MIDSLLASANPLDHVVDTKILSINGYWVLSNHIVMLLTTAAIMLVGFAFLARKYKDGLLVPTGAGNMFEALVLFIRNDVAKPVLGDDTDRFMPLLWTLFFFVLINNLLGLVPFDAIQNLTFGRVFEHFQPIYGTSTSNFFVTGALALIVFIIVQVNGLKANGFGGWLHHFLGGAPWWLAPVMVPVEFLGMLIKPFALAVRLAANMTAGHLLLAVLGMFVVMAWTAMGAAGGIAVGIVSVVASVAIMMLELFVAALQAYLFVFLTALFISQMIVHHHDDEHHKEHEADELGEPHAVRERDALRHDTAVKPVH